MIRTRAEKKRACISRQGQRRSACGSRHTSHEAQSLHSGIEALQSFFPAPSAAWHEDRMSGITWIDLSSARRGMGRHGAAWAATVPRTGNTACEVFHETRPFPFTGRQTFLLERTRPLDHGFRESRDTNFIAVRVAMGAQGTHNQKPPPIPPCTPPGRCFPARCGAALGGMGGILPPEPVSARRQPPLPPPSGLLPQRQPLHEPMPRKGNVLYDVHGGFCLVQAARPELPAWLFYENCLHVA